MRIDTTGEFNPFAVVDGKVVDKAPVAPTGAAAPLTIDQLAMAATAATWKWWGPIERHWKPDPVVDSLGRPERSLGWWFRGHWQRLPHTAPKP